MTGGQPPARVAPDSLVARFAASLIVDFDAWHDGTGYAVELIGEATAAERREIEALLLARPVQDWRDVEALAALGTPRAQTALRAAIASGEPGIVTAIARHAPDLVEDAERIEALVRALAEARFFGGLTQALDAVETFHPPAVVAALLRGVLAREGDVAVHFAAMLLYLRDGAKEAFDWDERPFVLRFNTEDRGEREQVFRALCERIGEAPEPWLAVWRES